MLMIMIMSAESVARQLVAKRSGGICEAMIPAVCQGRATNMHHRRKPGRVWNPANLLHLCGSGTTGCHGWIEANPKASREQGWWIFTGDGEPDQVLVFLRRHTGSRWFLLDDKGSMT